MLITPVVIDLIQLRQTAGTCARLMNNNFQWAQLPAVLVWYLLGVRRDFGRDSFVFLETINKQQPIQEKVRRV